MGLLARSNQIRPVSEAIIVADVIELADVGVVEGGDGLGFALKTVGELLFGGLDGDVAVEPRITGSPHFAHASLADGGDDLVGAEVLAGRNRHRSYPLILVQSDRGWLVGHPEGTRHGLARPTSG